MTMAFWTSNPHSFLLGGHGSHDLSDALSAAIQIGWRRPGCRSTICFLIGKKATFATVRTASQTLLADHSRTQPCALFTS